jgi:hypothetical protein
MIFNKIIDIERLTLEIENSNISIALRSIISSGANCEIIFEDTLSSLEVDTLEDLVLEHRASPLAKIDTSITAKQIRTAMFMSGVSLTGTQAAIGGLSEPHKTITKIAWEHSSKYFRESELVAEFKSSMNLTEEELDDLWILAKTF